MPPQGRRPRSADSAPHRSVSTSRESGARSLGRKATTSAPPAEVLARREKAAARLALEATLVWPSEVEEMQVDRSVKAELSSLPEGAVQRISRHLVAAGLLLDEEPAEALRHALLAQELAPRHACVREAVGVSAYLAGDYERARSALRSHRRMTGIGLHLPLLADAERALGEPGRALELAADPAVPSLPLETRLELAIVASGARRDLGQPLAAAVALKLVMAEAAAASQNSGLPRASFALGMALREAGRTDEALEAFLSAADGDEDLAEQVAAVLGHEVESLETHTD